eukprot:scaffold2587_cov101-Cylindrotheca_fusiformis.AAC.3
MSNESSSSLQRSFLWLWISVLFTVVSSVIFQSIPLIFPFLMSSYLAIRKVKATSQLIDDGNDEDIEMQPLEIAGTIPQLRRHPLTLSEAFQMAFFNTKKRNNGPTSSSI